jgi:hypothetical protein
LIPEQTAALPEEAIGRRDGQFSSLNLPSNRHRWLSRIRNENHPENWFFKNRPRLEALRLEARTFLRENPRAAAAMREYFSAERAVWAWKDGELLSRSGLVAELEQSGGMEGLVSTFNAHRHLWRTLESMTEQG